MVACGSEAAPAASSTAVVTVSSVPAASASAPASAAASIGASAAVSAAPPSSSSPVQVSADGDSFSVAAADARGAGVGFRLRKVKGGGLSRIEGDWLLGFSGPPGGPLGLLIEPFGSGGSLQAAFEKREQRRPVEAAPEEKLEIAGEKRRAQAFRVGSSLATTCTCLVELPAGPGAKTGLLLSFDSGCQEKKPADKCAQIAEHPTLKPLLKSLELVK